MAKKDFIPDPQRNPYRIRTPSGPQNNPGNPEFIDFNTQRVCPACGGVIKITHNFCKFCGVDLSRIEPIGTSDEVSKQLAITAATDPNAEVRKEAVDTLGNFGDKKVLGVLTYIMLHDPDPEVRREAVDELGDLHHPYSLETLAKALKDESPEVRKEAIEGLKKIKKKVKEEKMEKGKASEREEKSDKKDEDDKEEEQEREDHLL
ncbi:MAG: HEAT repeat domain-containing protein [Candidatus Thorarchaeota archaeon]